MQLTEPDFSRRLNVSFGPGHPDCRDYPGRREGGISKSGEVCERWDLPRQCIAWDSVDGFSIIVGNKDFLNQSRDPLTVLDDIAKTGEDAVIILKDFHEYWNNPQVKRTDPQLLAGIPLQPGTIVIVTPTPRNRTKILTKR